MRNKKIKIAINGYLDNNIGDDLMIKLFLKRFPNQQFYLYTNKTIIKNTFKGFENLKICDLSSEKEDLKEMDIYLRIGGSIFQIQSRRRNIIRRINLCKLKRIKRNGSHIAVIGSNFDSKYKRSALKTVQKEIKLNSLTVVRDEHSYEMLKGFKRIKNHHLADDIAYNLTEFYPIKDQNRKGLGISCYRSLKSTENNYNNYVALAKIADGYIEKTENNVYLFAFNSENENDLSAAHHVKNLSRRKDKIVIIPYLGNVEEFLSSIQKCEAMIAIRFHSAILSDIYKIPFLPIVYSNKMQNLLDDRNFKGRSIELNNLNDNLEIESIVSSLVSKEDLFNNFITETNANIHFDELEALIHKVEKR